jgi:hypothetical protein
VLKARILLKADASEAGEAWSDSQISETPDTSIDTIARTRQHLVEGGIDRASDNTIGRTLKKTRSNPTCRSNW